VLAELEPAQIAAAVGQEDHRPFTRVSGIGPKTAKLIALQLAGKLDGVAAEAATPASSGTDRGALVEALAGMGWPLRQAERAVAEIDEREPGLTDAVLLRRALIALGPAAAKG